MNNSTKSVYDSPNLVSEIKLEDNYKARNLLNILRARTFLPHPSAYFYDNGKKYSIKIMITEEE